MTITLNEALAALPALIAKAEAGEEILISPKPGKPTVKLVAVAPPFDPLKPHPELVGSVTYLDPGWTQPLPPEEWGDLADR